MLTRGLISFDPGTNLNLLHLLKINRICLYPRMEKIPHSLTQRRLLLKPRGRTLSQSLQRWRNNHLGAMLGRSKLG